MTEKKRRFTLNRFRATRVDLPGKCRANDIIIIIVAEFFISYSYTEEGELTRREIWAGGAGIIQAKYDRNQYLWRIKSTTVLSITVVTTKSVVFSRTYQMGLATVVFDGLFIKPRRNSTFRSPVIEVKFEVFPPQTMASTI